MANTMNKFLITLLMILISFHIRAEEVSCAYPYLGTNVMTVAKSCGEIKKDDLLIINKEILPKINWSQYGLECIAVFNVKDENKNGWYIVNQTGVGRISSFWTDNCCAPFREGMAVGLLDGKVIFYNQVLEIVKRTNYIWASGFENGYCKVCLGDLKKEKDKYGDHDIYTGGLCGYINSKFEVVVPLKYPFENTPKP